MDINNAYTVDLYVGQDTMGEAAGMNNRVKTLVSRQMLCDMTAKIEYNIWRLNSDEVVSVGAGDLENVFYDGLKYRNLNYMITGVRGSGKSTFLHYLIQSLTRQIDPFEENFARKRNRYSAQFYIGEPRKNIRCQLLSRFDPSFPHYTRGMFLISVVAAIQSKLEEVSRKANRAGDYSDVLIMECNQTLKKLDKAISRLTHKSDSWSELSEYEVAHLRSENSGLEKIIREGFRKSLELLCSLCKIDAFIVSIDDADTNFGQCAYVLEDLRLYMTSTRLVVLMAGDMDLYLERIREYHFSEFNLQYHQLDKKGEKYRMDFVLTHASQYLIKLFPLENQNGLKDLNFLSEKLDPIHCVLHSRMRMNNGRERELSCKLSDFVVNVFSVAINTHDICVDNFARLFLRMPLRSIIQVINSWTLDNVWSKLVELGYMDDFGHAREPKIKSWVDHELELRRIRNLIKDAVFAVLKNEVRFYDYNFKNLYLENIHDFYLLMQAMCHNMNDVEHGYCLTGSACRNYSDLQISLLLALSAHSYLRDLDGFLSYFLYGPASISLYAKAVKQLHHLSKTEVDTDSLRKFNDDFAQYLHGSSLASPSRWARHANMIWCFDERREGMHLGILRLRYTILVRKLHQSIFTFSERDVSSLSVNNEKMLQAFAMRVSMSRSDARDNSYFISLFAFLAFILKCVKCCKRVVNRAPQTCKNEYLVDVCTQSLMPIFEESMTIKSCRNPEWLISQEDEVCYNTGKVDFSLENDNGSDPNNSMISRLVELPETFNSAYKEAQTSVVKQIAQWYISSRQTLASADIKNDLSPQQMGRLWSKFYYGLKQDINCIPKVSMMKSVSVTDMRILGDMLETVAEGFWNLFSKAGAKESEKRLSLKFRYMISTFPLSKPFIDACITFAKELKNALPNNGDLAEVSGSNHSISAVNDSFCSVTWTAPGGFVFNPIAQPTSENT